MVIARKDSADKWEGLFPWHVMAPAMFTALPLSGYTPGSPDGALSVLKSRTCDLLYGVERLTSEFLLAFGLLFEEARDVLAGSQPRFRPQAQLMLMESCGF